MLLRSMLCPAEIGDALSAFEQQRQQNSGLLQQLVERDASLAASKAEVLRVQQQLETTTEQVGLSGGQTFRQHQGSKQHQVAFPC